MFVLLCALAALRETSPIYKGCHKVVFPEKSAVSGKIDEVRRALLQEGGCAFLPPEFRTEVKN